MLDSHTTLCRCAEIVDQSIGDEIVVITSTNRQIHLLNWTGALVLEALSNGPITVEALESVLLDATDGNPTDIASSLIPFLDSLREQGIVEVVAGQADTAKDRN